MVHKGDMQIIAQMLQNIETKEGSVTFKAPLVVAPPTYNIVDELKAEGDWVHPPEVLGLRVRRPAAQEHGPHRVRDR